MLPKTSQSGANGAKERAKRATQAPEVPPGQKTAPNFDFSGGARRESLLLTGVT